MTHITDCVACEGLNRFMRSERLEQWLERLREVGFRQLALPTQAWEASQGHVQRGLEPPGGEAGARGTPPVVGHPQPLRLCLGACGLGHATVLHSTLHSTVLY